MRLILAILLIISLSSNASASMWIGDVEIGLAKYQTSGYVSNEFIIRDDFSNIDNIYINSASIEIMHYIEGHQKVKVNGNEFFIYEKDIDMDIGVSI